MSTVLKIFLDDAGTLLRIVMAWQQYQAGTSFSILHNTEYNLDYVQADTYQQ